MKGKKLSSRNLLILSMCIFGTVGIFRRSIDLPSSLVALIRGIIGTCVLCGYFLIKKQSIDKQALKENFLLLLLSGAAIGINWIFLFEAYCYTSVATATLCYYLAPILVILAAPIVFREKLTLGKSLCSLAALVGMVLVSGILDSGFSGVSEMKGVLFGLAAAVLYASVIIMNKKMTSIPALDKTIFQLAFASIALLPYVLFTISPVELHMDINSGVMLLILGALHTGMAYLMYFGSMGELQAHTVALFSYLDPVLAIILSALLLSEPLTITGIVGAVLILGAACIGELSN